MAVENINESPEAVALSMVAVESSGKSSEIGLVRCNFGEISFWGRDMQLANGLVQASK